jgi:hypothetical protein
VKAPKCRLCSGLHWNNEPHVFATNTKSATNVATNNATNGERVANAGSDARGVPAVRPEAVGVGQGPPGVVGADVPDGGLRTANRRSRDAYNAYQREYMRKRRAKEV